MKLTFHSFDESSDEYTATVEDDTGESHRLQVSRWLLPFIDDWADSLDEVVGHTYEI